MKRLLLLLLLAFAAPAFAAEAQLAAVMRQDTAGSGWYLIDTPGHTPVRILDVTEESDGKLRLWYSQHMTEVNGVSAQPDETYTPLGLTVGASVGLDYTDISLFAPFNLQLAGLTPTWGTYITTTGGRFSIDTSTALIDGMVKVTHPNMPSPTGYGPALIVSQVGSATPSVIVQSQTRTGFVLQAPPSFWLSGCRVMVSRGVVRVRAQDVASTTGNLWFMGVAEIP